MSAPRTIYYLVRVFDGAIVGSSVVDFSIAVLEATRHEKSIRPLYDEWNRLHSDGQRLQKDLARIGYEVKTLEVPS